MRANERRAELMRILVARRQDTMPNLAEELGVNVRTIQRDVAALTIEYPLVTIQGNGGGVKVEDWYQPHKNILSQEQISVLEELAAQANEQQKEVIYGMLRAYGTSPQRTPVDEHNTGKKTE